VLRSTRIDPGPVSATSGIEEARRRIAEERERKLGALDLSDLGLTDLPPELFDLKHLKSLVLGSFGAWLGLDETRSANVIEAIPERFSDLASLESLALTGNPVNDLAPLAHLAALQSLDCSGTQVSDLAPVADQTRLRSLSASRCHLSDLPRAFLLLEQLSELYLFETSVPGIPAEVLSAENGDNCLEKLRGHLRDLEAGAEVVHEAKLMILGNGRVGKTQICRRLRGLGFDDTVPSTHGITVTAERWAGASDDEALNIWDFGGQDIYHGAHTLFMKTSAVFMIVWHPDFESAGEQSLDGLVFRNYPLPYWLEYVRTLGRKDCPVIVVQARCDRPEQEVRRLPADDRFLQFPSLKPCRYSAKTRRGQGALEDALRDAVQFLRDRDGISTIGVGRMRVLRQAGGVAERGPASRAERPPASDAFTGGVQDALPKRRRRQLAGESARISA
jgi:hypothetical protein